MYKITHLLKVLFEKFINATVKMKIVINFVL